MVRSRRRSESVRPSTSPGWDLSVLPLPTPHASLVQPWCGDMNRERFAHVAKVGFEPTDLSGHDRLGELVTDVLGVPEVDCAIDCVGFEAKGQGSGGHVIETPAVVRNGLMEITRPASSIGIPGLYMNDDPGAKEKAAQRGMLSLRFAPRLVIAALDVIVVRVRRTAAGRERVAEPMHVAALVGYDVRERRHLLTAEVAEQLLERDLLGELLWIVLDLSDVGKRVVLHRIQLGRVVVSRPIGEMRARLRDVLQVRAPVLARLDQLTRQRRQIDAPWRCALAGAAVNPRGRVAQQARIRHNRAERAPPQVRSGLAAGGRWIRTFGPPQIRSRIRATSSFPDYDGPLR
jgi:hypothetical protein